MHWGLTATKKQNLSYLLTWTEGCGMKLVSLLRDSQHQTQICDGWNNQLLTLNWIHLYETKVTRKIKNLYMYPQLHCICTEHQSHKSNSAWNQVKWMQQSYDYFAQANIQLNLITSCKESVHIRLFLPYPTAHTTVVVNRKQIDCKSDLKTKMNRALHIIRKWQ